MSEKMMVALFESRYGSKVPFGYEERDTLCDGDYVRISEPVEVEFHPRKSQDIVDTKREALMKKRTEAMHAVNLIDDEIKKLDALPAPEVVSEGEVTS